MRFLHTSDWHLGRIFHGVHLTDDQAHVLEQFTDLIRDCHPDVILVAGDIYDRAVPPVEAVQLLDDVLSRILLDFRVPVIIIAGNHDSPERLGFGTRLLARQGLHLAGDLHNGLEPVLLHDVHGPVYFCTIPYAEPPLIRAKFALPEVCDHDRATRLLIGHITSRLPDGKRTVAMAHVFTTGGEVSESERPLTIGGSGLVNASYFQSFNYTALGHLHRPQRAGCDHVRYAGSLLKYSFSEANHRKSVIMVEMDDSGLVNTEEITLTPRRNVRCISGLLEDILKGPRNGESKEDYLMITLRDNGPILDAIGKLREVYPNVLHIERPHFNGGGKLRAPAGDHRRLGIMDLFSSFYSQVTEQQLTAEEADVFTETMQTIYMQEREGSS